MNNMSPYEHHQLLKFLYFEGYADSYQEADYLLEEMNDDDFSYLYEEVIENKKIINRLLDEGYAETPEAAEAIMVNMSEEWRESIMIDEGLDMKTFKANRKKAKASAARADAVKRGHVGKEWYNSGRRYSPDEARRGRANMDDEERRTRHRSAVDPDNENDDNFSADKTKNPKKLRKQKAMGELG